MNHILAALDFSDMTEAVVKQAEQLAAAMQCPLTLLHVAAPDPEFVGFEVGPQTVRDARAEELKREHAELHRLAAKLIKSGLTASAKLVGGPTVATILEEAKQRGATMIVMGSHGHGALYEALVGSISEGVVRKAPCPVLLVPHRRT